MKHKLQWKFIVIMFMSMFAGLIAMAVSEAVYFGKILGISPEEAEIRFPQYSPIFDAVFIVVSIIMFLVLSRKTLRRIEEMNRNVESIALGKTDGLAQDKSKDELGSLSRNINTMAATIREHSQKEKNMVCNIAHDLRTPITSITGYAEMLKKSDRLSDEEKNYVDIIHRKSGELSYQVNELLEYSILEFREKEYSMEEISLSRMLEQVIIDFIPEMEKSHIEFSFDGNSKPFLFLCNQNLMIRLFENMMTNCIRYGKEGRKIDISIYEDNELIVISFSDYSTVLTDSELNSIFDPFCSGDNASDYRTESKGLGLSICRSIAEIHGGSIQAISELNTGKVTFLIKL